MINVVQKKTGNKPRALELEVSLSPSVTQRLHAVRWVLIIFGVLCLSVGFVFASLGAGPVLGFMGIEAVLLLVVYVSCKRSSRVKEVLNLTCRSLLVRRIDRKGNTSIKNFKVCRLAAKLSAQETVTNQLVLSSRVKTEEIGGFLSLIEKIELSNMLNQTLVSFRSGQEIS